MGILKIPRITTTQRLTITPEEGELLYDTTNDKIYKGDNSTVGGVEVGAGGLKYDETTGTGAAYISDLSITGYTPGDAYLIEFHANNTVTNPTISIGGFAGITIVKNVNDPLEVGDIVAGRIYLIAYDGANFQLTTIGGGGSTQNFTSTVKHQVKAGVALTKGQAVYVSSADGTNMIVSKADYSQESTSAKTMGLIAQNLALNEFGYVVTEGLLDGLNTDAASQAGDPVWLGDDGNLIYGIANKPYAPKHMVAIGIVTRKNPNNGEIFVKIQNGFELEELHNVDLITTAPTNGDVLAFNGNLWVDVASTSLNINANNLTTGTVPLARLGTNTPTNNTFLGWNNTWTSVVASGTIASGTARRLAMYTTVSTGTALGGTAPTDASFITLDAQAAARSFTIPAASANSSFIISSPTTPQTIVTVPTTSAASLTFSGNGSNANRSQIEFTGTTMQSIDFGGSASSGVALPSITTNRSAGTKLILFRSFVSGTSTDYAIGISTNAMWYSIAQATSTFFHRWYGGATELMNLRGDGFLTLNGRLTLQGNGTVGAINSPTPLALISATNNNFSAVITNATNSGSTITYTTSAAHGFYRGARVTIASTTSTAITATITGISADGTTITFTANNTFAAGNTISITSVTSTPAGVFNLTNATIATATATEFTVTNSATGTYSTGGTASTGANAYNLTNVLIASAPTTTSFTVASGASGTFTPNSTASISNVTATGGVVTYTTTANHGFTTGQTVVITGVDPVAFNITGVITVTTLTAFTITNAATGTYNSGGTASRYTGTGTLLRTASILQFDETYVDTPRVSRADWTGTPSQRSIGTKLLFKNTIDGGSGSLDTALGFDGTSLWYSGYTGSATSGFDFYGANLQTIVPIKTVSIIPAQTANNGTFITNGGVMLFGNAILTTSFGGVSFNGTMSITHGNALAFVYSIIGAQGANTTLFNQSNGSSNLWIYNRETISQSLNASAEATTNGVTILKYNDYSLTGGGTTKGGVCNLIQSRFGQSPISTSGFIVGRVHFVNAGVDSAFAGTVGTMVGEFIENKFVGAQGSYPANRFNITKILSLSTYNIGGGNTNYALVTTGYDLFIGRAVQNAVGNATIRFTNFASIFVESKTISSNRDDLQRPGIFNGASYTNSPWSIFVETERAHFGGDINIGGAISTLSDGAIGARLRVRGASGNAVALLVETNNAATEAFRIDYNTTSAAARISFFGVTPAIRQTALTTTLTTVTFTAPVTPDYAVAGGTSAGFGFSTADEFRSVMSVIANLQTRVNELETKLRNYGLLV